MVSNLQLNPGMYATAATAVLALVSNHTDIVADFVKSLRHTAVNTDAAVVLMRCRAKSFRRTSPAAMPGFWRARKAVNGQLSQPEQSTRWVRDARCASRRAG
jgi:multidrug resistance efflux pump